jgi:hypothetical protein
VTPKGEIKEISTSSNINNGNNAKINDKDDFLSIFFGGDSTGTVLSSNVTSTAPLNSFPLTTGTPTSNNIDNFGDYFTKSDDKTKSPIMSSGYNSKKESKSIFDGIKDNNEMLNQFNSSGNLNSGASGAGGIKIKTTGTTGGMKINHSNNHSSNNFDKFNFGDLGSSNNSNNMPINNNPIKKDSPFSGVDFSKTNVNTYKTKDALILDSLLNDLPSTGTTATNPPKNTMPHVNNSKISNSSMGMGGFQSDIQVNSMNNNNFNELDLNFLVGDKKNQANSNYNKGGGSSSNFDFTFQPNKGESAYSNNNMKNNADNGPFSFNFQNNNNNQKKENNLESLLKF